MHEVVSTCWSPNYIVLRLRCSPGVETFLPNDSEATSSNFSDSKLRHTEFFPLWQTPTLGSPQSSSNLMSFRETGSNGSPANSPTSRVQTGLLGGNNSFGNPPASGTSENQVPALHDDVSADIPAPMEVIRTAVSRAIIFSCRSISF